MPNTPRLRIKSNAYYVLADHPGISGFKDWTRKEEYIVTGLKARNNRTRLVREYVPSGTGRFRMDDGHLPDFQPVSPEAEALRWLNANPYASIRLVPQLAASTEVNAPAFAQGTAAC